MNDPLVECAKNEYPNQPPDYLRQECSVQRMRHRIIIPQFLMMGHVLDNAIRQSEIEQTEIAEKTSQKKVDAVPFHPQIPDEYWDRRQIDKHGHTPRARAKESVLQELRLDCLSRPHFPFFRHPCRIPLTSISAFHFYEFLLTSINDCATIRRDLLEASLPPRHESS